MYKYILLTGISRYLPRVARIDEHLAVTIYDVKTDKWKNAPDDIMGIYTGEIECEHVSEKQANEVIERWRTLHA